MTELTTDLSSPSRVPYFMWDEPMTVTEIKERLDSASMPERLRLMANSRPMMIDAQVHCYRTQPGIKAGFWLPLR